MSLKLSFIVPVYAAEKYVEECIQSILNQTFQNIELILVEDGSPDESGTICDCYSASNVTILHESHRGVMAARITGVLASKGDYITFVDADDWIEPTYAEVLLAAIEKHDADIAVCSYTLFGKHGVQVCRLPSQPESYHDLCRAYMSDSSASVGTSWSKIFRRQVIVDSISLWDSSLFMGEDTLLAWATVYFARKIIALPGKFLYHYRQHSASATHQYAENLLENNKTLLGALSEFAWEDDLCTEWQDYLSRLSKTMIYSIVINEAKHRVSIKQIMKLTEQLNHWMTADTVNNLPLRIRMCNLLVKQNCWIGIDLYIRLYYLYRKIKG